MDHEQHRNGTTLRGIRLENVPSTADLSRLAAVYLGREMRKKSKDDREARTANFHVNAIQGKPLEKNGIVGKTFEGASRTLLGIWEADVAFAVHQRDEKRGQTRLERLKRSGRTKPSASSGGRGRGGSGGRTISSESASSGNSTEPGQEPRRLRSASFPCAGGPRTRAAATAGSRGGGGCSSAGPRTSSLEPVVVSASLGRSGRTANDAAAAVAASVSANTSDRVDHRGGGDTRKFRLGNGHRAGGRDDDAREVDEETPALAGRSGRVTATDRTGSKPNPSSRAAGMWQKLPRPAAEISRPARRKHHHVKAADTSRRVRMITRSSSSKLYPPPLLLPPAGPPPQTTHSTATAQHVNNHHQERIDADGDASAPAATRGDTARKSMKRRSEGGVEKSRAGGFAGGDARKNATGAASSQDRRRRRLNLGNTQEEAAISGSGGPSKKKARSKRGVSAVEMLERTALQMREELQSLRFIKADMEATRRERGLNVLLLGVTRVGKYDVEYGLVENPVKRFELTEKMVRDDVTEANMNPMRDTARVHALEARGHNVRCISRVWTSREPDNESLRSSRAHADQTSLGRFLDADFTATCQSRGALLPRIKASVEQPNAEVKVQLLKHGVAGDQLRNARFIKLTRNPSPYPALVETNLQSVFVGGQQEGGRENGRGEAVCLDGPHHHKDSAEGGHGGHPSTRVFAMNQQQHRNGATLGGIRLSVVPSAAQLPRLAAVYLQRGLLTMPKKERKARTANFHVYDIKGNPLQRNGIVGTTFEKAKRILVGIWEAEVAYVQQQSKEGRGQKQSKRSERAKEPDASPRGEQGSGGRAVSPESRSSGNSTGSGQDVRRQGHVAAPAPETAPALDPVAPPAAVAATTANASTTAAAGSNGHLAWSGDPELLLSLSSAARQRRRFRSASLPCADGPRTRVAASAGSRGWGGCSSAGRRNSWLEPAIATASLGGSGRTTRVAAPAVAASVSANASDSVDHRGGGDTRNGGLGNGHRAGGEDDNAREVDEDTLALAGRSGRVTATDGTDSKPNPSSRVVGKRKKLRLQRPAAERSKPARRKHHHMEAADTSRGVRMITRSSLSKLYPPPLLPPPAGPPPRNTHSTATAQHLNNHHQERIDEDGDGSAPAATRWDTARKSMKRRSEDGVDKSRMGGFAGGDARKNATGAASSHDRRRRRLILGNTQEEAAISGSGGASKKARSKRGVSAMEMLERTALQMREELSSLRFIKADMEATRRERGLNVLLLGVTRVGKYDVEYGLVENPVKRFELTEKMVRDDVTKANMNPMRDTARVHALEARGHNVRCISRVWTSREPDNESLRSSRAHGDQTSLGRFLDADFTATCQSRGALLPRIKEKWKGVIFDKILLDHYWLPGSKAWVRQSYLANRGGLIQNLVKMSRTSLLRADFEIVLPINQAFFELLLPQFPELDRCFTVEFLEGETQEDFKATHLAIDADAQIPADVMMHTYGKDPELQVSSLGVEQPNAEVKAQLLKHGVAGDQLRNARFIKLTRKPSPYPALVETNLQSLSDASKKAAEEATKAKHSSFGLVAYSSFDMLGEEMIGEMNQQQHRNGNTLGKLRLDKVPSAADLSRLAARYLRKRLPKMKQQKTQTTVTAFHIFDMHGKVLESNGIIGQTLEEATRALVGIWLADVAYAMHQRKEKCAPKQFQRPECTKESDESPRGGAGGSEHTVSAESGSSGEGTRSGQEEDRRGHAAAFAPETTPALGPVAPPATVAATAAAAATTEAAGSNGRLAWSGDPERLLSLSSAARQPRRLRSGSLSWAEVSRTRAAAAASSRGGGGCSSAGPRTSSLGPAVAAASLGRSGRTVLDAAAAGAAVRENVSDGVDRHSVGDTRCGRIGSGSMAGAGDDAREAHEATTALIGRSGRVTATDGTGSKPEPALGAAGKTTNVPRPTAERSLQARRKNPNVEAVDTSRRVHAITRSSSPKRHPPTLLRPPAEPPAQTTSATETAQHVHCHHQERIDGDGDGSAPAATRGNTARKKRRIVSGVEKSRTGEFGGGDARKIATGAASSRERRRRRLDLGNTQGKAADSGPALAQERAASKKKSLRLIKADMEATRRERGLNVLFLGVTRVGKYDVELGLVENPVKRFELTEKMVRDDVTEANMNPMRVSFFRVEDVAGVGKKLAISEEKWNGVVFDKVLLDHYWLPGSKAWVRQSYLNLVKMSRTSLLRADFEIVLPVNQAFFELLLPHFPELDRCFTVEFLVGETQEDFKATHLAFFSLGVEQPNAEVKVQLLKHGVAGEQLRHARFLRLTRNPSPYPALVETNLQSVFVGGQQEGGRENGRGEAVCLDGPHHHKDSAEGGHGGHASTRVFGMNQQQHRNGATLGGIRLSVVPSAAQLPRLAAVYLQRGLLTMSKKERKARTANFHVYDIKGNPLQRNGIVGTTFEKAKRILVGIWEADVAYVQQQSKEGRGQKQSKRSERAKEPDASPRGEQGSGGRAVSPESRSSGNSTGSGQDVRRQGHVAAPAPETAPALDPVAPPAAVAATTANASTTAAAGSNGHLAWSGDPELLLSLSSAARQRRRFRSASLPCADGPRTRVAASAGSRGWGGCSSAGRRNSWLEPAIATASLGGSGRTTRVAAPAVAASVSANASDSVDHRGGGDTRNGGLGNGHRAGGEDDNAREVDEDTLALAGRSGRVTATDGTDSKPNPSSRVVGKRKKLRLQRPAAERSKPARRKHHHMEAADTSRGVRMITRSSLSKLYPPPLLPPPAGPPPRNTHSTATAQHLNNHHQERIDEDGDGSAPAATRWDTARKSMKRRSEGGVDKSRTGGFAGGDARKNATGAASSHDRRRRRLILGNTQEEAAISGSGGASKKARSKRGVSAVEMLERTALQMREELSSLRFIKADMEATRRERGLNVLLLGVTRVGKYDVEYGLVENPVKRFELTEKMVRDDVTEANMNPMRDTARVHALEARGHNVRCISRVWTSREPDNESLRSSRAHGDQTSLGRFLDADFTATCQSRGALLPRIKEKWKGVIFDKILLDHYWLPGSKAWVRQSYLANRGGLIQNLVKMSRTSLLRADFEIVLPINQAFFELLLPHFPELDRCFTVEFLVGETQEDFKATHLAIDADAQIPADVMMHTYGKDPELQVSSLGVEQPNAEVKAQLLKHGVAGEQLRNARFIKLTRNPSPYPALVETNLQSLSDASKKAEEEATKAKQSA
eukprot:g13166.t1